MLGKIQSWGNSQGIRINKQLLDEAHFHAGEEVQITAVEGKIIIEAAVQIRGRYDLAELVAKMPASYCPKEENWGESQGKEIW